MPCCVFFGHKDADSSISSRLREAIVKLICEQGVNEFLVGNNGRFDYIVYSVLKEIKASIVIRDSIPIKSDTAYINFIRVAKRGMDSLLQIIGDQFSNWSLFLLF